MAQASRCIVWRGRLVRANKMTTSTNFHLYEQHVNPILAQFLHLSGRAQKFVRAEGCTLITDQGERYTDWISGFGALNLGHNPSGFQEIISEHLSSSPPNLYPESLNPFAGEFAASLVNLAGSSFETCFFSNSGSEAVEAAIKASIAATGRKTILSCEGAYHGTTLGALSLMSAGHYRKKFEPLLPYVAIPWNSVEALMESLTKHQPAALIVEPMQADAGMRMANANFLRQASSLCHDSGALFILDEVQTGMGRTGKPFAFQQMDAKPDILVLGKSLGAGLIPIGATLYGKDIFHKAYGDYLSCEVHNSTFGGNALACRIGLEVVKRIDADFLHTVRERGKFLETLLHKALRNHPLIVRITMCGLLGGITLEEVEHPWFSWKNLGLDDFEHLPVTGPLLVHRMHRRKFLTQICAHDWNTVRIEPPLIITNEECEAFVSALKEEMDWIHANS